MDPHGVVRRAGREGIDVVVLECHGPGIAHRDHPVVPIDVGVEVHTRVLDGDRVGSAADPDAVGVLRFDVDVLDGHELRCDIGGVFADLKAHILVRAVHLEDEHVSDGHILVRLLDTEHVRLC